MTNRVRWVAGFLVASLLMLSTLWLRQSAEATPEAAAPSSQVQIRVNQVPLQSDTAPIIVAGRVLVPMRALFEALGASVTWDGATQSVTAQRGELQVHLTVGETLAQVGDHTETLDVPPQLLGGRTLVPLRFVAQSLGAQVSWDPATRTVSVDLAPSIWRPKVGATFQWQLADKLDLTVQADVYDLDAVTTPAATVAALHAKGRRVICYINVGAYEEWQADKAQFPAQVLGKDYPGWPGEKFLDIRRLDVLGPIMKARLDVCKAKGFDGVEPDNIDGYQADTGFPLTAQDQLTYNRWIAQEAHARGLSIGLKNDQDQAKELEPAFDWALTEDCFQQKWCDQMLPFLDNHKAVFATEYTDTGITLDQFCPDARRKGFSAILKHRNLDAWRQTCSP